MNKFLTYVAAPLIVVTLLAMVGILGVVGTMTSTEVSSVTLFLISATGVAGTVILIGPQSDTNLLGHLSVYLAVIGLTTAMGVTHVFTDGDVENIISALLGAGSLVAGIGVVTSFFGALRGLSIPAAAAPRETPSSEPDPASGDSAPV